MAGAPLAESVAKTAIDRSTANCTILGNLGKDSERDEEGGEENTTCVRGIHESHVLHCKRRIDGKCIKKDELKKRKFYSRMVGRQEFKTSHLRARVLRWNIVLSSTVRCASATEHKCIITWI